MLVEELQMMLRQHPAAPLHLTLPDGQSVPEHFHVTEVGKVQKDFIDCGGTSRSTAACVLQVWVAQDTDHRLDSSKLSGIIELASSLGLRGLPIEIEYESTAFSQYRVRSAHLTGAGLQIQLDRKHTACLALDRCIISDSDPCCSSSECCP